MVNSRKESCIGGYLRENINLLSNIEKIFIEDDTLYVAYRDGEILRLFCRNESDISFHKGCELLNVDEVLEVNSNEYYMVANFGREDMSIIDRYEIEKQGTELGLSYTDFLPTELGEVKK